MKRLIPLIVLAIVLASGSAYAAEATANVDVMSAYVWRGYTFNDGLVVQPSIDVASEKGFGVNVWGNFDIDDYDGYIENENNFSEIDLTLYYNKTIGKVDVGVGLIEYLFPGSGSTEPGTREIYGSVGMGIVGGLSAGLTIYYDIDEIHDYYAELALDYSYDFTEALNLGAGASLAYAGDDWSYDGNAGLHNYKLYLSIGYTITDAWSVGANINYVNTADDDVLNEDNQMDVNTYGGVSVSYTF